MALYDSESDSDMENAYIDENFLHPRRKKHRKQQVFLTAKQMFHLLIQVYLLNHYFLKIKVQ